MPSADHQDSTPFLTSQNGPCYYSCVMKSMTVKLRHAFLVLALVLTLGFTFSACGSNNPEVTVFAAASLADVLQPLGEQFELEQGIEVKFSFGGSWSLAQQVSRGAPADVFLAAGPGPMNSLEEEGLIAQGSRSNLLGNTLVIVGADPRDAVIFTPESLLGADVRRIAMGNPALAPAGSYAREALQAMGLWEDLQDKLIYGLNVRTALQYVISGNADVAIVYATDASSDDSLRPLWAFPPESHSPIRYPIATLKHADNPLGAEAFQAFLHSAEAAGVLMEHGFTPHEG